MSSEIKSKQNTRKSTIRNCAIFMTIVAGIQIAIPLAFGSYESAIFGVVLAVLAFGVSRHKLWCGVAVLVLGVCNMLLLMAAGVMGNTMLTVALIYCSVKAVRAIRAYRKEAENESLHAHEIQLDNSSYTERSSASGHSTVQSREQQCRMRRPN